MRTICLRSYDGGSVHRWKGFPMSIEAGAKTYTYRRVSSAKQLAGDGLDRQARLIEAYCDRFKPVIVADLDDAGLSAFTGSNVAAGKLGRFMAAVQAGQVSPGSVLLVESLDRISREHSTKALHGFTSLLLAGVRIVTLEPFVVYDGKDQSQMFLALATMIRSHEESAMKSARVLAANRRKLDAANAGAGIITTRVPGWMKVVDGRIVLDEAKAEAVRLMFRKALEGWGYYRIMRLLKEEGIPTFSGRGHWASGTVGQVLRSKSCMGVLVTGKDEVAGYYPAVVSEADFLAVQAGRERGKPVGRRGKDKVNLFSGLVFCGACGSRMRIENKGKPGRRYYVCVGRAEGGTCSAAWWREAKVQRLAVSYVAGLNLAGVMGQGQAAGKRADLVARLDRLRAEVDGREAVIRSNMDKAELYPDLADDFLGRSADQRKAVKALEMDMDAIQAQLDGMGEVVALDAEAAMKARGAMLDALGDAGEDVRQAAAVAIRKAVGRVVLFDKGSTQSSLGDVTDGGCLGAFRCTDRGLAVIDRLKQTGAHVRIETTDGQALVVMAGEAGPNPPGRPRRDR